MARKPLTCSGYIELKDGRTIPIEEMTPEERERVKKSMSERLGRVLSEYFTQHPDEFEAL